VFINGSLINTPYLGAGQSSALVSVDESTWSPGWNSIEIDYGSISGTNGLTVNSNGTWAPPLATYNAVGTTINGLTGAYYTLDGTHQPATLFFTDYGETTLHYTGGTAPWSGPHNGFTFSSTSAFEEELTGYIYIGTGTPLLSLVPADQQSGDGAAPEAASWLLIATALPLMLFSKLRLSRARAHA
jgi:hypothetical protein